MNKKGIVKFEEGLVIDTKEFKVVKKVGKKGDEIVKHNHPEANVLFTVVKGKAKVYLNDVEEHILESGKILNFDGDNFIQVTLEEDSEIFVTLINKR